MRRRAFLQTSLTASALSLAGCLGYTIEETSNIERRKTDIQSLRSTVSSLQSTVTAKEEKIQTAQTQITTLETEVRSKSTEIAGLESELERIKNSNEELQNELSNAKSTITANIKKRIETLYERGVGFRDIALQEWNSASSEYDNQNYIQAARDWAYSYGHYDGATELFFLAATIADDNGFNSVTGIIADANNYCLEIRDAADDYSIASHHYAIGNTQQGDDYISRGNNDVDDAQNYSVAPLTDVQNELGI